MNVSESSESSKHADLILKLCNHLAKNDSGKNQKNYLINPKIDIITVLSSSLCKTAFSFLSKSSSTSASLPSDEQYVVVQIKQFLTQKSPENGEKFDLIYSNICKSVKMNPILVLCNQKML